MNTANDVINTIQGSALFGTMEGAKVYREMVGWLTGGLLGRRRRRRADAFGRASPRPPSGDLRRGC